MIVKRHLENLYPAVDKFPCQGINAVNICIDLIICFDHKLCLAAEAADPHVAQHCLVGEVPVCVQEVPLHKVLELRILLFYLINGAVYLIEQLMYLTLCWSC